MASSVDGQGSLATFNHPWGVATDFNGNLFVSDYFGNCIRKINATGFVSTFAGSGNGNYADGQGISASFNTPVGVYVDSVGNVYVADNTNQLIRMINSTGYVTTIAGSGTIGSADGQSASASFYCPFGIWFDSSSNNIYFTDQWNHKVRVVNASGYVTTIAGNGVASFVNGQGRSATFNSPNGIALDAFGNIYVADLFNNVIRMINSTGYVSTYAGSGLQGSHDGNSSTASFNNPAGLSIDFQGNSYVSELGSIRIRMINTTGYVRTIAGNGIAGFRDGYGRSAEFNWPMYVAVDSNRNVYVADTSNNRIRKIDMNHSATTTTQTNLNYMTFTSAISASYSSAYPSASFSTSPSPNATQVSFPTLTITSTTKSTSITRK